MMKAVNPYLNFPGNTEEAFNFYRSVFGGEFLGVLRYRDFGDNAMGVPEKELDRIAHIALPLGEGNMLMGTDALESQPLTMGTNFYLHLETDSPEDTSRIFDALSRDGKVEMPVAKTEWAEQYGICTDRFGVQWMVSFTGNAVFEGGE
jgi:PhnB protein